MSEMQKEPRNPGENEDQKPKEQKEEKGILDTILEFLGFGDSPEVKDLKENIKKKEKELEEKQNEIKLREAETAKDVESMKKAREKVKLLQDTLKKLQTELNVKEKEFLQDVNSDKFKEMDSLVDKNLIALKEIQGKLNNPNLNREDLIKYFDDRLNTLKDKNSIDKEVYEKYAKILKDDLSEKSIEDAKEKINYDIYDIDNFKETSKKLRMYDKLQDKRPSKQKTLSLEELRRRQNREI